MMSGVLTSILDAIGQTPLVRLRRVVPAGAAEVLAKIEACNPGGSVKDRIALAMVEAAEASGQLRPGGVLVEATSGNTGVGLCLVAAVKGYRVVLTMPADMSAERQRIFRWLGAAVHLTPAVEGMSGAVWAAEQLAKEPGHVWVRQFENPANPAVHERTTAQELWQQTGGRLDALVAGVGTGGTLTGVARALKARCQTLQVVAVEPARANVLQGGRPGPHRLHGLGAGFVPGVLDARLIDAIHAVSDEEASAMASRLAREEGLFCGISSGAAVVAAVAAAERLGHGKRVVAVLPDTGERYLSLWEAWGVGPWSES